MSCGPAEKRRNIKKSQTFPSKKVQFSQQVSGKGSSCVKFAIITQNNHRVGALSQERDPDRVITVLPQKKKCSTILQNIVDNGSRGIE